MASVVLRRVHGVGRLPSSVIQRWSTAAAAVPLTEPVPHIDHIPASGSKSTPAEIQVTKLGNGITVASLEDQSFASNVSVFVRAGSRYETYPQRGLTHLLRNSAFLASGDRTAFRIAREIDLMGGSLSATSTREHLIYSAEFLRGGLDLAVDTLGTVISSPKFQDWEVEDQKPRVKLDIAAAEATASTVVLEELHRAAFRDALSNPLYCPSYNLSKLSSDNLKSFVEQWFTGGRITIVGAGVGHSELVKCAQSSFGGVPEGTGTGDEPSQYVGGTESHLPSGSPLTHAAIVCKGAGYGESQTDVLAAGVLQHLLGVMNYVKWGSNVASASFHSVYSATGITSFPDYVDLVMRLMKAASASVDAPFAVSALNLNYSDNGLFGMYTVSDGSVTGKLLKAVMKEFSEVAKGNISNKDLARAKNQLKACYLMSTESQCGLVEDIGQQTSLKGSYTPLAETLEQVDAITKDKVVKFAKAVFATRATFVAYGNLSNTPRLDHLLAEVSLK